jgi:hypothetical protein
MLGGENVKRHLPLQVSIGGQTSHQPKVEALWREDQKSSFLFKFNLLYKELIEFSNFFIL